MYKGQFSINFDATGRQCPIPQCLYHYYYSPVSIEGIVSGTITLHSCVDFLPFSSDTFPTDFVSLLIRYGGVISRFLSRRHGNCDRKVFTGLMKPSYSGQSSTPRGTLSMILILYLRWGLLFSHIPVRMPQNGRFLVEFDELSSVGKSK